MTATTFARECGYCERLVEPFGLDPAGILCDVCYNPHPQVEGSRSGGAGVLGGEPAPPEPDKYAPLVEADVVRRRRLVLSLRARAFDLAGQAPLNDDETTIVRLLRLAAQELDDVDSVRP